MLYPFTFSNYGFKIEMWTLDPCVPNPCGEGAVCDSKTGNALCSCPKGRSGDPLLRCGKMFVVNF